MRHQTRIAIVSAAAGFGFAGVLQVAALLATQSGFPGLGRVVDWPTSLLHALTANDAVAIFAGFPLGGVAYAVVANLILRKKLEPTR
jgi:hypothetical protein